MTTGVGTATTEAASFPERLTASTSDVFAPPMTVLFVSHDTAAVKSLCQRCVYLSQGKVKAIGNAAKIGDMYLRDQRGSMNSQTETVCPSGLDREAVLPTVTDASVAFRRDADFASRVAPTRQGSGDVHFTCVEILDANGAPLAQAEFDQLVTIRLHMEFIKNGVAHGLAWNLFFVT